jgi:Zn-dependent protease with chaperone function
MTGNFISCPSCGNETLLETASPESPVVERLSVATLLSAFRGDVRGQRASLFYQLGLLFVAGAILILPLFYLGFVAAGAYSVYWWATRFTILLKGPHYGIYLIILKFFLYLTPLIVGSIVVFFMFKPLLARRTRGAQPLALNPANEPLLFAFINQVCRTVGSPVPSRIDINCELNASASFRRGFRSFFGDDLVLTLGLPLVAGMNLTQLGGIIAHEFGHFSQSFAMRMTYIINTVNRWFARVIYSRDQWDLLLDEWAQEEEDWRVQMIITCAIIGVAFSRQLLKPLMWIGVGISAFVSRQMEYNADAYSIEFVGSGVYEETAVRLETLSAALDTAYKQVHVPWNNSRALTDNFPKYIMLHDARMPDERRAAIADRVGLAEAHWYSTHPASGDRIRAARRSQKPGVFSLDIPAAELFSDFDVIARQVSLLHYTDDMGIPGPLIQLRPTSSFFETARGAAIEPLDREREELEKKLGPGKLKLNTAAKTTVSNPDA